MARKNTATKKKTTSKKHRNSKKNSKSAYSNYLVTGLILVLFGLFGLLKLGYIGTLIANVFRLLVGDTYIFLAVIIICYGVSLVFLGHEPKIKKKSCLFGAVLSYMGVLLFLHARLFGYKLADSSNIIALTWQKIQVEIKGHVVAGSLGGGMVGGVVYGGTHFLVSQLGTYILALLAIFCGVFLMSGLQWDKVVESSRNGLDFLQNKQAAIQEKRAEKLKSKQEKAAQEAEAVELAASIKKEQDRKNQVKPFTEGQKLAQEAAKQEAAGSLEPEQLSLEIDSYQKQFEKENHLKRKQNKVDQSEDSSEDILDFEIPEEAENRDYELPPTTLLNEIPLADQSGEYQAIEKNVDVLEKTFKSFGVNAKVVKAVLGPAVTKYEIQPAVGVKVSKIVGLTDDIALALAAKDVRIEAPIPGKSLIGIEVPNSAVSTVSFRDIVEAKKPHPEKLLEVPLGRDISGTVITADLAKMPHLLIAGSTGSGKSVCINGIITSILMQAKPHEVKMMMIDPKKVELNVYNGIPHLLTPVVTNPRKASQALHKVVQEMERRYELFAASGARNITGYNDQVIQSNLEDGKNRPILPFIVVVVDELADLMMVASNEVEEAITRLAQMARAAGIHMILATQRPSVDVITGIIKANVPSRIAFAVSSGTDSRTIIDSNGAEKLLGRGDMLFLPMGENKPIRVQGALISDHEVEKIVSFVTDQQEADYQADMMPSEETETVSEVPQDELYEEAKALIVEMQTASISLLQRRFRIGYNRAARLIDELEANGVIGASEGSKPRKVLLHYIDAQEETSSPEETD